MKKENLTKKKNEGLGHITKTPLNGIDFKLLKKQKKTLFNIMCSLPEGIKQEHLDGIINLIDQIQDYAVDELGLHENDVFDLDNE